MGSSPARHDGVRSSSDSVKSHCCSASAMSSFGSGGGSRKGVGGLDRRSCECDADGIRIAGSA